MECAPTGWVKSRRSRSYSGREVAQRRGGASRKASGERRSKHVVRSVEISCGKPFDRVSRWARYSRSSVESCATPSGRAPTAAREQTKVWKRFQYRNDSFRRSKGLCALAAGLPRSCTRKSKLSAAQRRVRDRIAKGGVRKSRSHGSVTVVMPAGAISIWSHVIQGPVYEVPWRRRYGMKSCASDAVSELSTSVGCIDG